VRPAIESLAVVVKGPFPRGTQVNVPDGHTFVGLASIAMMTLLAGTHTTLQDCDFGMYTRDGGLPFRAGGPVGRVRDAATGPREARVFLEGTLVVSDALTLSKVLGDSHAVDDGAVLSLVQRGAVSIARGVIAERLERGAWSAAQLAEGGLERALAASIAAGWRASKDDGIAGTTLKLTLSRAVFSP